MVITRYNPGAIKVQVGDKVVVFSPGNRQTYKSKPSRFSADIVLVSIDLPFSAIDKKDLSEEQSLVDGPGEYELSQIFIKGFSSAGPRGYINTIYTVDFDGIKLAYLGALADGNISAEAGEEIGSADIVFVPLGEEDTLSVAQAAKMITNIQAKVIIPIFSDDKSLNLFKKEMGDDNKEVLDKLTIKKKDLEGKESEVVALAAL